MTFSAHVLSSRGRGLARSLLVPPTLDPQVISAGCWLPVHLVLRIPGFRLQPRRPSERHMRPRLPGSNPTPNSLALTNASGTSFSANANYDLPELSLPLLQRQVLFQITHPNVCHYLYCSHPTGSVASSPQMLQQPPAAFRSASAPPFPARVHQPERSFKSVISSSFFCFPKLPRVSQLTGTTAPSPTTLYWAPTTRPSGGASSSRTVSASVPLHLPSPLRVLFSVSHMTHPLLFQGTAPTAPPPDSSPSCFISLHGAYPT